MTKDKATLNHARHNEEACKELLKSGEFNDWVITTAYYAAIYYVSHELFPGQYDISGKPSHCQNFHDFYAKFPHPKDSKHSVREDLVRDAMPEIYTSFSTLREMCTTARYKTYKISKQEVELAMECLDEIKLLCDAEV